MFHESEREINDTRVNKILRDNKVDYDVDFINTENNNGTRRVNPIKELTKSYRMNALGK